MVLLQIIINVNVWSLIFICNAFTDDNDTIPAIFRNKLNEITVLDSSDVVTWDLNCKGVSTVKSYYLHLLILLSPLSLVLLGGSLGKLFGRLQLP